MTLLMPPRQPRQEEDEGMSEEESEGAESEEGE